MRHGALRLLAHLVWEICTGGDWRHVFCSWPSHGLLTSGTPHALLVSHPARPSLECPAGFNQYTLNFLNLLVDTNRIDAIDEICESFEVSYCALTDTQVSTTGGGGGGVHMGEQWLGMEIWWG